MGPPETGYFNLTSYFNYLQVSFSSFLWSSNFFSSIFSHSSPTEVEFYPEKNFFFQTSLGVFRAEQSTCFTLLKKMFRLWLQLNNFKMASF